MAQFCFCHYLMNYGDTSEEALENWSSNQVTSLL